MKKRKTFLIVITTLFLLSAGFSVFRFNYLNYLFPNPQIVKHHSKELIEGGEISIRITKSYLYNGNDFENAFKDYNQNVQNDDGSTVSANQYKVLFINLDVVNKSSKQKTISLAQFYAETLTWTNGIDAEVYNMVNKNKNAVADPQCVELKPNEKKTIILTYMMYDFQFQPNEWKKANISNFDLSLSRYPIKHIVTLES